MPTSAWTLRTWPNNQGKTEDFFQSFLPYKEKVLAALSHDPPRPVDPMPGKLIFERFLEPKAGTLDAQQVDYLQLGRFENNRIAFEFKLKGNPSLSLNWQSEEEAVKGLLNVVASLVAPLTTMDKAATQYLNGLIEGLAQVVKSEQPYRAQLEQQIKEAGVGQNDLEMRKMQAELHLDHVKVDLMKYQMMYREKEEQLEQISKELSVEQVRGKKALMMRHEVEHALNHYQDMYREKEAELKQISQELCVEKAQGKDALMMYQEKEVQLKQICGELCDEKARGKEAIMKYREKEEELEKIRQELGIEKARGEDALRHLLIEMEHVQKHFMGQVAISKAENESLKEMLEKEREIRSRLEHRLEKVDAGIKSNSPTLTLMKQHEDEKRKMATEDPGSAKPGIEANPLRSKL